MADLLGVLTMMAIPAGILYAVRCVIVRQNRRAEWQEAVSARSPER